VSRARSGRRSSARAGARAAARRACGVPRGQHRERSFSRIFKAARLARVRARACAKSWRAPCAASFERITCARARTGRGACGATCRDGVSRVRVRCARARHNSCIVLNPVTCSATQHAPPLGLLLGACGGTGSIEKQRSARSFTLATEKELEFFLRAAWAPQARRAASFVQGGAPMSGADPH